VLSPATVRSVSNLDTLRRPFARTFVNVLPKRKYTTVQVKMCVVYKDEVQKNTYGYLHYFSSSEEPIRLSTNTLGIGERDRSEGVRWRQSPSWCSSSVLSHLSRFQNLQLLNFVRINSYISDGKLTDLRKARIRLPRLWHQTSGLFAGNNCANVEEATALWRWGNFWRHPWEMKLLFCIYIDFGACVDSVKL
jgi:hypothetical protein